MIRLLAAVVICGATAGFALERLHEQQSSTDRFAADQEVLYLPDGSALDILSFGYKNVLANVLWFKTISYFGKHYKTDRDYRWLSHMCSLITDLNPKAEDVFSFCGTMLSWEVEDASAARDILSKAIQSNPGYWRYYYLRGFVLMYFLEDPEGARQDFTTAAKLPGAPPFVVRLAASKISMSDPYSAIAFLSQMLESTEDPYQRASLEDKLNQMKRKLSSEHTPQP